MSAPHTYGQTRVSVSHPWGLFHRRGTRLLCADGKLRAPSYLASTPDTFFSTPCAVRVGGKYVTGYMTVEEEKYVKGEPRADYRRAYVFRQHTGQETALPLWPAWPKYDSRELTWERWQELSAEADKAHNALIAKAHETQEDRA